MNAETLFLTGPHHAATCDVAAVVANWHDEHHSGGFSMCQDQPCGAVRAADRNHEHD